MLKNANSYSSAWAFDLSNNSEELAEGKPIEMLRGILLMNSEVLSHLVEEQLKILRMLVFFVQDNIFLFKIWNVAMLVIHLCKNIYFVMDSTPPK
jgi:hypothetical protein